MEVKDDFAKDVKDFEAIELEFERRTPWLTVECLEGVKLSPIEMMAMEPLIVTLQSVQS